MSTNEPPSGYRVGRNRPPFETRFKPGQSGNPKGRPKKTRKSFDDEMLELLLQDVTLNGNRTMPRLGYVIEALTSALGKGKIGAAKHIFEIYKYFDSRSVAVDESDPSDYGREIRRKLNEMAERRAEERKK